MSFNEDIVSLVNKSDNELLGSPTSWPRVPLSSIARMVNGFPFKSHFFNDHDGVPLIRIRDVTTGTASTFYNGPIPDGFKVSMGDILVGMDGDFRLRVWSGPEGLLNQRVCKVIPTGCDGEYLACILPPYLQLINDHTSSVTVKHLSSRTLAQIPIPLPDIDTQRKVALAARAAQEHIQEVSRDISRARLLRQKLVDAVIDRAFELLEDDADWIPLGDCLIRLTSGSRDWSRYYRKGSDVFVLAANVRPMQFNSTPLQIVEAPVNSADAQRTRVECGDVLMTIVGANAGDTCVVRDSVENYYVCQSVALLRVNGRLDPEFLALYLNSMRGGKGEISRLIYGQGRPHIGFADLKKLKIPIVPRKRQKILAQNTNAELMRLADVDRDLSRSMALSTRLRDAALLSALS